MESERDEKICETCIFCYPGMLEASGYILCGKISEQKSYSKLEFETGLDEIRQKDEVDVERL